MWPSWLVAGCVDRNVGLEVQFINCLHNPCPTRSRPGHRRNHREFPGVEMIFIFRSGQANNTASSPTANNNTDLEQQQTCGPHDTGTDFKSCCGISVSQTVSIRWFIVMIAFVGICCAVVGTVLGAMKASGREHLTVSLLMIGQYHSITPVTSSQGEFQSEFSHSVHPF